MIDSMNDFERKWAKMDSSLLLALNIKTFYGEIILIGKKENGKPLAEIKNSMQFDQAVAVFYGAHDFFPRSVLSAMPYATTDGKTVQIFS